MVSSAKCLACILRSSFSQADLLYGIYLEWSDASHAFSIVNRTSSSHNHGHGEPDAVAPSICPCGELVYADNHGNCFLLWIVTVIVLSFINLYIF